MADVAWIVFSFLAFILNIAPLCWQIKHGNAGPVCLGVWVLIASLNSFINGVLWRNDAFNRAPIFCDISVKLQAGTPIGILASVICILLLLARALRTQPKLTTARQRKLRAIFEYAFCLGWPAMTMILQVLWQSYRFGIAKDTGCAVPVANVWPFWAFYLIWTPVFSLIGALLSLYIGYRLVIHRKNFRKLLGNSDSALTTSRFIRLGLMSLAVILFDLPMSIYHTFLMTKLAGPFRYTSIKNQFDPERRAFISYLPFGGKATIGQWSLIIVGFFVVVFFGFSNEALFYYAKPLQWLGILKTPTQCEASKAVAVSHITLTRHDATSLQQWADPEDPSGDLRAHLPTYSGPFSASSTRKAADLDDTEKGLK